MLGELESYEITEWQAFSQWERMEMEKNSQGPPPPTPEVGPTGQPMDNSVKYDEKIPDYLFD